MRLLALLLLASTAACATLPAQSPIAVTSAPEAEGYSLAVQRAKIARIQMRPDVSFLSAEAGG